MFEKLQFWKKSSSLDSSSSSDFPMPDFSDSSTSSTPNPSLSSTASTTGMPPSTDTHTGVGVDTSFPTGLDSPKLSSHTDTPIQDPFADSMHKASSSGEGIPSSFDTPSVTLPAQPQPVAAQASDSVNTEMSKRDVDLILSRLDLIKSEIENMQHRMIQLEQEVKTHQKNNNNVW